MNLEDIKKLNQMRDNINSICNQLYNLIIQTQIIINGEKKNELFKNLIQNIKDNIHNTLGGDKE